MQLTRALRPLRRGKGGQKVESQITIAADGSRGHCWFSADVVSHYYWAPELGGELSLVGKYCQGHCIIELSSWAIPGVVA